MARLRHIAIATEDTEKTAQFYREGLGLREVSRVDNEGAEGYYLTDGYINIAILRFKNDKVATTEGTPRHAGLHHIGFGVDRMEEAERQVLSAGALPHLREETEKMAASHPGANVEVKFTGPDRVTIDLSEVGWVTD